MSTQLEEVVKLLNATASVTLQPPEALVNAATVHHETTSGQDARSMLMAQARTLDTLFAGMVRRATGAQHVEQVEGFMRVALKAQAQCARTLQVAAGLGMPGHVSLVQVNHATTSPPQNELSGARYVVQTDSGTPGEAGGAGPPVEAMGEIDRPTN